LLLAKKIRDRKIELGWKKGKEGRFKPASYANTTQRSLYSIADIL
jgi:hypothetical protein